MGDRFHVQRRRLQPDGRQSASCIRGSLIVPICGADAPASSAVTPGHSPVVRWRRAQSAPRRRRSGMQHCCG
jgi:hypothetical protein